MTARGAAFRLSMAKSSTASSALHESAQRVGEGPSGNSEEGGDSRGSHRHLSPEPFAYMGGRVGAEAALALGVHEDFLGGPGKR